MHGVCEMFIANTTHTKIRTYKDPKGVHLHSQLLFESYNPRMRILTCDILVKYENHGSIRTDLLRKKTLFLSRSYQAPGSVDVTTITTRKLFLKMRNFKKM